MLHWNTLIDLIFYLIMYLISIHISYWRINNNDHVSKPDDHCPSSDRDQCGENIVVVDDTCQEEVWPEFDCSCQRLNISSSARVQEYHPGICLSSKYHPDIYLSSKYHPGIYFSSKYHPGIYLCLTTNWEQTPALDDYKHCQRNNGPIVLEP